MALEMRNKCETCAAPLALETVAFICSYECTFCGACCADGARPCPNCKGELVRRPKRRVTA